MADPYAGPALTGPSSKTVPAIGTTASAPGSPYIIPTADGWSCTSLLTTGNEIGGYRLAGVPDGLGAFDNGDGTITLLVNHEIDGGFGTVRAHGGRGAFVSRWVLDRDTLEVKSGREFLDQPAKLNLWSADKWVTGAAVLADPATSTPAARNAPLASAGGSQSAEAPEGAAGPGRVLELDRLCSADLAPISAFYNRATKRGHDGHIYLNGEEGETRANRAFAWVLADGTAHELPAFAHGVPGDEANPPPAWENLLANPATGNTTLIMANSDGGPSHIYAYIGAKRALGSPIERAGLVGGRLFSLRVAGVKEESRERNVGLKKSRLGKGMSRRVGLVAPNKGTAFLRPEDGAWDPRNPRVYYFATTDQENFAAGTSFQEGHDTKQVGRSRLWAVTFDSIRKIATDGRPMASIQLLLDGTEGGDMFDNITVDRNGIVYLCEDTGEARHTSKIWANDIRSGKLTPILKLDPAKFGSYDQGTYVPPTAPFVDDKETSGILDVTDLFSAAKWFRKGSTVLLVTVQAHFGYDGNDPVGLDLNEGGQLLLLVKAP